MDTTGPAHKSTTDISAVRALPLRLSSLPFHLSLLTESKKNEIFPKRWIARIFRIRMKTIFLSSKIIIESFESIDLGFINNTKSNCKPSNFLSNYQYWLHQNIGTKLHLFQNLPNRWILDLLPNQIVNHSIFYSNYRYSTEILEINYIFSKIFEISVTILEVLKHLDNPPRALPRRRVCSLREFRESCPLSPH